MGISSDGGGTRAACFCIAGCFWMVVCVAGLFATGTGFCAGCVPGSGITVADVARGAAATEAGGFCCVPGRA
ncbi:MAG: hypothetical protein ACJ78U_18690, partial [Myxococcales bacterium]